MEVEPNQINWAADAFATLNAAKEQWPPFSNNATTMPGAALSLPPSLLTESSIERFGQITPPDELSPAEPRRDSAREGSAPFEQQKNETPWPEHQVQALQSYQPSSPDEQEYSQSVECQERSSKRRRTSQQPSANQRSPTIDAPQQQNEPHTSATGQPSKRKRGRPKSQPQMVEAYTADGFPFQVSSARQSHLEKNRVAAHKCRQRKKEYINGLEGRAREFSSKNKALKENVAMLREELLQLKNEVLRHAGCSFWAVDEYLAQCAGDLLGVQAPSQMGSQNPSQNVSPTLSTLGQRPPANTGRETSTDPPTDRAGMQMHHYEEDYGGLELLNDFDDEMEHDL